MACSAGHHIEEPRGVRSDQLVLVRVLEAGQHGPERGVRQGRLRFPASIMPDRAEWLVSGLMARS